jgi:7,8-dihydro-6-hydroxymethylpterin dimethyltransferase
MSLRDYTFLGVTQSLCPECLTLVPAKILDRGGRVYFRKQCPTHGVREDFICSDVSQYDQLEFSLPGRMPAQFGTDAARGCPYDCGLCTEHEQHTCIGLVEITSSCNLHCPMCYAASGPGGTHLSFDDVKRAIDRLVEVEGRPEVLQLSGGEPTLHPEFEEILDYACGQPIDVVMVNTNGLRLARDRNFAHRIGRWRHRLQAYLQFDGFRETTSLRLRGECLVKEKLKAVEILGELGIATTLVMTLQPGVNDDELGELVRFGLARPWITGLSLQPATYSGRFVLPEELEQRITFPDVIREIARQTDGLFRETDFMPLPCAHPNCHSLAYAYRKEGTVVPLTRFIDAREHLDLLANGITFNRAKARSLIEDYLGKAGCCGGNCASSPCEAGTLPQTSPVPLVQLQAPAIRSMPKDAHAVDVSALAEEFFRRALAEEMSQSDVFRITITSFLDAYNFDVRRLMKCCTHHVLPSGHVIPFCAYNVLYRTGIVPLPTLTRLAGESQRAGKATPAGILEF